MHCEAADLNGRIRLAGIVESVMEIAPPPVIDRIGIRCVDRWSDPEFLDDIGNMLIPEILGPFRSVENGSGIRIEHTIGNHRLLLDSGAAIQFRSGFIPAGTALDQAIPAADTASWILDIDVFQEWPSPIAFAGESINNHVRQVADYAHSVFRWATTAEFIERYQAEVAPAGVFVGFQTHKVLRHSHSPVAVDRQELAGPALWKNEGQSLHSPTDRVVRQSRTPSSPSLCWTG